MTFKEQNCLLEDGTWSLSQGAWAGRPWAKVQGQSRQTLVLSEAPLEARLSGGLGGQDSGLETERRASIMVPAEA